MEELRTELERLKVQLAEEKEKTAKLEEECDLLAVENDSLRSLANSQPIRLPNPPSSSNTSASNSTDSATEVSFFIEGDGSYVKSSARTVPNASSGKNVISTAIFASPLADQTHDIIFCGGVDAHLRGYSAETGQERFFHPVTAPVLCIAIHSATYQLACGMMDGSVVHLSIPSSPIVNSLTHLHSYRDHSKYVAALHFSPDEEGGYLLSISHDRTLCIYQGGVRVKVVSFNHTPESCCFVPPSLLQHGSEVLIGLRGAPYLIHLNIVSEVQRRLSLNEQEWDHHVSFTPMALVPSPDSRYLLIGTDKSMHLIVNLELLLSVSPPSVHQRVRVLTGGHVCGDYGQCAAAWDPASHYLYCNSEGEHALVIYSIATGKAVKALQGHRGIIRGLAAHPARQLVVTASYDKSLIYWV